MEIKREDLERLLELAQDSKFTQQHVIDVGDMPGHQVLRCIVPLPMQSLTVKV
jgi:hypothetical protein